MDPRPIGVFDSGIGGLTALRELQRIMPGENIIYLGDTAHMPYGGRPPEELRRLAVSDSSFLRSKGVKAILVACGTISSNCIEYAYGGGIPVVGVLQASVRDALKTTKNGCIGVLATAAAAASGAFEREIHSLMPDAEVVCLGNPLLVPFIEQGRVSPDDSEVVGAVRASTDALISAGADTVILGCTHFPLLAEILKICAPDTRFIDSGAAGAGAMAELLRGKTGAEKSGAGSCRLYTTGDPSAFGESARRFRIKNFEVEHAESRCEPGD